MARRRFTVKSQVERARRKRRALTVFSVVILAVLAIGAIWVLRHKRLEINEVNLTNDTSIRDEVITSLVRRNLEGQYLFIIPKSNFLLYPRRAVVNDIEKISEEVLEVRLRVRDYQKLEVTVENRVPYSIWCGLNGGKCFLADKNGLIFKDSPKFSYDLFPKFMYDFRLNPVGRSFLNEEIYKNLLSLYEFIEDSGVGVSEVLVKNKSFSLVLDSGTLIFFDPDEIEAVASNFEVLLTAKEYGENGFDFSQAEYVDLRYGNKVFWKPESQ